MKLRRGVSPIISAMLLIVIVISAFSILYASTQGWITAQRSEPLMAMQERFVIEDIWFRSIGTQRLATIFVRNGGEVDINVMYCTVDDVSIVATPDELELAPGAGGDLNITFAWTPDTTYKVQVKTARGSTSTAYETA